MEYTDGRDDWAAYEQEKKELQELSPDEYEAALKELGRRMGI